MPVSASDCKIPLQCKYEDAKYPSDLTSTPNRAPSPLPTSMIASNSSFGDDTRAPSRRPSFHITAPIGWLNDPCAPFFDTASGIFHVYFQWSPSHFEWNSHIGWGHAWSTDLVRWEVDNSPVMMPGDSETGFDVMGVFTGTMDTRSLREGPLLAYLTTVDERARSAQEHGYQNGQEGISVALSADRGNSWAKVKLDVETPSRVTGWRDPFYFQSSVLSASLAMSPDVSFCLLSGGLIDQGPTVFLYSIPSPTMSNGDLVGSVKRPWTYFGPLIKPEANLDRPRSSWTGDRGWNWECANLFHLPTSALHTDFITPSCSSSDTKPSQTPTTWMIVGSEGKWIDTLRDKLPREWTGQDKMPMWQLWFSGSFQSNLSKIDSDGARRTVSLDIQQEGIVDWGCFYAATTFEDPSSRRLMLGWLIEDDIPTAMRRANGFTGSISIPRELFEWRLAGVLRALKSPLRDLPCFEILEESIPQSLTSSYTVRTLGQRPAREIYQLRDRPVNLLYERAPVSSSWQCEISASVDDSEEAGLRLEGHFGTAMVIFLPEHEMIVVRRRASVLQTARAAQINTSTEHGKHTLFTYKKREGVVELERLHLQVFWDEPILEIFANSRFALSTHLYCGPCRPLLHSMSKGKHKEESEQKIAVATAWTHKPHF